MTAREGESLDTVSVSQCRNDDVMSVTLNAQPAATDEAQLSNMP